jgi:outer membrane receptor protein involved in Fe transport
LKNAFHSALKYSAAPITLVLCANPAFAQAVPDPAAMPSTDEVTAPEDAIVVTGSRIRIPNLSSPVPVTSIAGENLLQSGTSSIGDKLNQLPSLRSTFSQSNSTRFLGTAGLNLLDLRGLGTQRTLVLLNGRRHVGSDILSNGVSPDTNTFPSDLIERVDVVTGGSSAVYGSDAIAGVVNFILKRDFEGIQLRGQSGVSKYKDAGAYFGSLTAGTNFGDGRGNVAVSLEYARQNEYFGGNRPFIATSSGFLTVDSDPSNAVSGSDSIPDTRFFRDIRSAGLSNTGVVRLGGNAAVNGGRDNAGAFFNLPYQFAADGTLAPITGLRVGLARNGSFIGGNGENFTNSRQIQLSPALDRYSANVIGHYTFSEAFEPFFEAKYSRTDVIGTGGSGPAFITGATLGDPTPNLLTNAAGEIVLDSTPFEDDGTGGPQPTSDNRENPRLNNPFLGTQARTLLTQQILASGINPFTRAPLSDSEITSINDGTFRFPLRLNMLGLGARTEAFKRETYRAVAGVRGTFNDDWNYEVSANYGEFKEKNRVLGNLNVQRFLLGVDAVADPLQGGKIVCKSQIDPTAAIDYVGNAAILAADIASCTPVNLFGGQFTEQQKNYLLTNSISSGKITQLDVNAFISGDLSQLFELPGGPIGFSIGAEYRRETNFFTEDPLVSAGYTFYNAIPTFTAPAFEVKEAFGEIRIPLLKDIPLIHELTITGAGRVSKYKLGAGTVYTYNGGLEYSPFSDLRLRANYARAVRAPNLGELFAVPGQNFATVTDPCSARNLGKGTSNRAKNCTAAGAPATYDFVYSQSLEIVSGGNRNLKAETSDSYTLGGVYQPSYFPGFSISADYYNIKVKKAISSVGAQTIIDQCYDLATLNNPYCSLFKRNTAAAGPRGEELFQILEGSLLQSSINFSGFKVRGLDVEVNYKHDFDGFGQFQTRLNYTHTFQNDSFQDPTNPKFITRNLYGLGDPVDEFVWGSSLKAGKVTLGYDLRFIGKQLNVGYTDIFGLNGDAPQNLDASETNFYPRVFYHDISAAVDVNEKFNLYGGINNLTNQEPPLGLDGTGGGDGIYDNRGRFFYLGFKAKY